MPRGNGTITSASVNFLTVGQHMGPGQPIEIDLVIKLDSGVTVTYESIPFFKCCVGDRVEVATLRVFGEVGEQE